MTLSTGYRNKEKALKEKLKEFGEIYLATCTVNGKTYVGQAVLLSGADLRQYGTQKRWISHLYEAKTEKLSCRYLNNAINKYCASNFTVEPILTCKIDKLTYYEDYFIIYYKSMVPNGYNLRGAGRCGRSSDETKQRMSESIRGEKHPQFGVPLTEEVKEKIRQTNINNAVRTDRDGTTILQKYMKCLDKSRIYLNLNFQDKILMSEDL